MPNFIEKWYYSPAPDMNKSSVWVRNKVLVQPGAAHAGKSLPVLVMVSLSCLTPLAAIISSAASSAVSITHC